MRKVLSWFAAVLLTFSLGACAPKEASLEEAIPFEPELSDTLPISANPLVGCWLSPQDSTSGKLCIYEDSVLFYDLLMAYPYYTKGDSLIVTSPDGDVFIRWRYLRQNDTLLLFQRPQGSLEEYMVLMTLSSQ